MALGLSGCGSTNWGFPYKATIQQGNWITTEQIAKLETGMTRDQVRFILGTPTLQDIFHAERWDYPYYNQPGYGDDELRKFTVWFENDTLTRWSGDEQPDRQPFQRADSGKESIESADAAQAAQDAASPGVNPSTGPNTQGGDVTPQAVIETGSDNTPAPAEDQP
jgi:outer membrane protein assembly factor BamE